MGYVPNTDEDIGKILDTIGAASVEDLFAHIPESLRVKKPLDVEGPFPELGLVKMLKALASRNGHSGTLSSFLGGGAYSHFIPSVVDHLASRSEFSTSYTPYQPEISQGTLQAIFEYQTMVCMLTGMDVSNASVYDGATGTAEAVLMALRITGRRKVLLSRSVNPEYRAVVTTYAEANDREVIDIPFDERGGTDAGALSAALDADTACVVLQSPNYFGVVEEPDRYEKTVHQAGALLIGAFSEPLAFAVLKPGGESGADIVCGEGQSFGIPLGYGGPYLGMLACRERYVRNLPGRIVGRTVDLEGRGAYVLTLSAREQHIRREKATSNICTNQGLCALRAAVYMTALGKCGLRRLASLNAERARYAAGKIARIDGAELLFDAPFFNEFVIRFRRSLAGVYDACVENGILPGIPLGERDGELEDCLLVTVTEMNEREEIDRLCSVLEEVLRRVRS